MAVDVVLGLQRGDEGKGRIVDLLAQHYDIVARFNGGPNAGHTIARDKTEPLRLHQIPSGIAYTHALNIVGNGAYVDPVKLLAEMEAIIAAAVNISPKNLRISNTAHLILPHHIKLDEIREAGRNGQGSTVSGIAFVGCDKYKREGIRAELIVCDPKQLYGIVLERLVETNALRKQAGLEKFDAKAEAKEWTRKTSELVPYITDTVSLLHEQLQKGADVLAEGAQAFGLDIEHGMYPYVTSSHTTVGGVLNGLGIGASHIGKVVGVAKATKSHVGGGPFVTKISEPEIADKIRGNRGEIDAEYGATTGRERQVGWLDLVELRKAIAVSGVTELALTKLDAIPKCGAAVKIATAYQLNGKTLSQAPSSALDLEACQAAYEQLPTWTEDISNIRHYDELPAEARDLVDFISKQVTLPVSMIGVGPERDQIILDRGLT